MMKKVVTGFLSSPSQGPCIPGALPVYHQLFPVEDFGLVFNLLGDLVS